MRDLICGIDYCA